MSTRKQRPRNNLTYKNCLGKFTHFTYPQIRTVDLSGRQLVADIKGPIEGCDWRGAISIYFHMDPLHPALHDGPNFYFMLPSPGSVARTSRQTVFLAMFHHLYNRLLLIDPSGTPVFQTPIQEKYEYIKNLIEEDGVDEEFLRMSSVELNNLLATIQDAVHYRAYTSWADFIEVFKEPWSEKSLSDAARIDILDMYIYNTDDLIEFLEAPIDVFVKFTPDSVKHCEEVNQICSLILRKLDCHEIFMLTGVKPKELNWIQELDLILKGGPE